MAKTNRRRAVLVGPATACPAAELGRRLGVLHRMCEESQERGIAAYQGRDHIGKRDENDREHTLDIEIEGIECLLSTSPAKSLEGAAAQLILLMSKLDNLENPGERLWVEREFQKAKGLAISALVAIGKHGAVDLEPLAFRAYVAPFWPFIGECPQGMRGFAGAQS